ncbi:CoA ester lyase [Acrocarpospora macrocephala]|uniref:CoA ester lyase n=1 Tax=Acrocarpospora macrocephala TaxID=150177 RepID=A0A5M3WFP0_9ACTN|nr:CoA ester lyase [Acrocarpospora macrocephala]GES07159.1 CoA ester lyase [Acrocarpospora macrocephala]
MNFGAGEGAESIERLRAARSLLFVPADDRRKVARAWTSGADAVVLDLEDAVAPARKDAARQLVSEVLPAAALLILRVNGTDTPWAAEDLRMLDGLSVDAVMLPKASPESLVALGDEGPPVIALIETAAGLRRAYEIASHTRVVALALGGADLGAELGWAEDPAAAELLHARSVLVVDSAAAGIRAPFDVVHLAVGDPDGARVEAEQARRLGLGGKLCIHPRQVPVVNTAFAPSQREREQAARVVQALDEAMDLGSAVAVVDGKLVDAPVARRARATLRAAEVHSVTTSKEAQCN